MSILHYFDPHPGGKPAVLLLHGLGATGVSWIPQLPVLTEAGFRPLAIDIPGFGNSIYDGRGWSIKRQAYIIAEWLRTVTPGRVHLVGLSMGGVLAQQITHDFPDLINKLVLISTFSKLRPDSLSGWIYFINRAVKISTRGLASQASVVADRIFPGKDQDDLRNLLIASITSADERAYKAAMLSMGVFNSSKWLCTINQPTLILTGKRDTTISPDRQRILAQKIPNSKHVFITGAGHAVNIDQPDEFNRLLLDFLI
jgi:3-oxoadipate enol-lactonase